MLLSKDGMKANDVLVLGFKLFTKLLLLGRENGTLPCTRYNRISNGRFTKPIGGVLIGVVVTAIS